MLHPPPTLAVGGGFFMSAPPWFYFSLSLLTRNCIICIIQLTTVLFE